MVTHRITESISKVPLLIWVAFLFALLSWGCAAKVPPFPAVSEYDLLGLYAEMDRAAESARAKVDAELSERFGQ